MRAGPVQYALPDQLCPPQTVHNSLSKYAHLPRWASPRLGPLPYRFAAVRAAADLAGLAHRDPAARTDAAHRDSAPLETLRLTP